VRADPITEITPSGLRTAAADYDLDVLIFATGFDAVTGSLTRMNVTGTDGAVLPERWASGPVTYLGMLVAGFPNLFMVHGPGSPGVLAQMIAGGEWQVDWLARLIEHMESRGHQSVDTTPEWEGRWNRDVREAADRTLYKFADSWYLGANIPGKPRVMMMYVGGFHQYTQLCEKQASAGYEGFTFTGAGHDARL